MAILNIYGWENGIGIISLLLTKYIKSQYRRLRKTRRLTVSELPVFRNSTVLSSLAFLLASSTPDNS